MEIKRHNYKWNISEVLKLQREFELLGMNIHDIAKSHSRSGKAILCKLEREGFIESWSVIKGIEEFIESNNDLCDYKSLILDGYNLNNNCEILSSITSSENKSEIESDEESETLYENLLDITNETNVNESIYYLTIKNWFLLTMKAIYFIFQFVEKNFTKKMIF